MKLWIPRPLSRLYALLFGYFWLPCPNCGRWFGGHEQRGGTINVGIHLATCENCVGDFNFDPAETRCVLTYADGITENHKVPQCAYARAKKGSTIVIMPGHHEFTSKWGV